MDNPKPFVRTIWGRIPTSRLSQAPHHSLPFHPFLQGLCSRPPCWKGQRHLLGPPLPGLPQSPTTPTHLAPGWSSRERVEAWAARGSELFCRWSPRQLLPTGGLWGGCSFTRTAV